MSRYEGVDLLGEINTRMALMDVTRRELEKHGRELAQAERDYRVANATAILSERADNKTPVSIISDVVKGRRDIADLRLKRDIAEVMYKSAESALQNYKLQARLLEEQLKREWGAA